MALPDPTHPLYCPQSGAPPNGGGCGRCGRDITTRGTPERLLPHLRYRPQEGTNVASAVRAGVLFVVEPVGHEGRAKDGKWAVRKLLPAGTDGIGRVAVHDTIGQAIAEVDMRNGWPVVDGIDVAVHLAEWHDRRFDRAPGERAVEVHDRQHTRPGRPHTHDPEGAVGAVRPTPAPKLGIIGRERSLIAGLAGRLQKDAIRAHDCTKVWELPRGGYFEVHVRLAGELTGRIARVTVELDRVEEVARG